MPSLKRVIFQIMETANISSDPANQSRVRTMFFEEYAIIAKRAIENYGVSKQYLQTFDVETVYDTNIPISMRSHSIGGMRRSENPIPPIVTSRNTDYLDIRDQLGQQYSPMTDQGFIYKGHDKYMVNTRPVIFRNGYFWLPGTIEDVDITLATTAVFVDTVDILQFDSEIGISVEDDMELPIPYNIISVVINEVLAKNFAITNARQQQDKQQGQ